MRHVPSIDPEQQRKFAIDIVRRLRARKPDLRHARTRRGDARVQRAVQVRSVGLHGLSHRADLQSAGEQDIICYEMSGRAVQGAPLAAPE